MTDFRFEVIRDDAHRPWPVPERPWMMRQTWSDLLFAHWPIPPQRLRPKLPPGLTLDLYNGEAWIGVVRVLLQSGCSAPRSRRCRAHRGWVAVLLGVDVDTA
jgi:uncharacterized protein YqjF (DUF2071 family)